MAKRVAPAGSETSQAKGARFPWPLALVALSVAVGVAVVPVDTLPYYAGAIIFFAVAAVCLTAPTLLLYFVILTSALSGLLRIFESVSLGGGAVSLSGLRWTFVFGLAFGLLVINYRSVRIPRIVVPFLILAAWAVARFLLTPLGTTGLKDIIFYALPPLVGLYALFVARVSNGAAINRIEKALLYSAAIPIIVYMVLFVVGEVSFTETGPQGLIGPRTVADYLLIILALALAVFRYGENDTDRTLGLAVSAIAVATIFFTLSRAASVTALGLVIVSRANPRHTLRLAVRGVVVVGLAVLLIWNVPYFRERSFHRIESGFIASVGSFNTMGRSVMWPLVFVDAMKSPVIGQGPGSARLALVRLRPKGSEEEHHPHNEYLQVFHDLGLIGLAILLWGWVRLVLRRWRSWSAANAAGLRSRAKWEMAATLAAAAVVLTAVTGNTFHYASVMGPAFMIFMIAEYTTISDRRSA